MFDSINPIAQQGPPQGNVETFKQARSEKAFKEFEAMYINMMLKEMRNSVPEGGLFEKNQAMEYYEEMLDEVFSKSMAESGQLGLAKQMSEELRIRELHRDLRASETIMEQRALEPLQAPAKSADN